LIIWGNLASTERSASQDNQTQLRSRKTSSSSLPELFSFYTFKIVRIPSHAAHIYTSRGTIENSLCRQKDRRGYTFYMETPESGSFEDHENAELIDLEEVMKEIIARNELIERFDPLGWEFNKDILMHY
jgi:hypothetical protein